MSSYRALTALTAALLAFATCSNAATYRLGVPPVMSQAESTQRYDAFLRYLSDKTGHRFELVVSKNFMGYWQSVRKADAFDFVLDGSHLAAYRVDRHNHHFVARLDGVVSYSLVARGEDLIIEPDELLTRSIAILPTPNMSAIALAEIFNNPSRQPKQIAMPNAEEALDAVRNGTVDAAIVPTAFLPRYPGASVVLTTQQMPGLTMTASAEVPQDVVAGVQKALLQADSDPQGKQALDKLRFVRFIEVTPHDYQGLGQMLSGLWGY